MHCPFCHTPASETQLKCGVCGFTLERVDQYFGVLPRLHNGLSDLVPLFTTRACRKINAAMRRLQERFPQVSFSVVTTSLRTDQPLSPYAFWILNCGGICRELHRGGRSRDLLLTIDEANDRAALIIGYGLEPFLSPARLQNILEVGSANFAAGQWAEGVVAIIERTTAVLIGIFEQLPRIYGIDMDAVRRVEDAALAKPELVGVY